MSSFEVEVPEGELTDLRDRLRATRWSPEPANDDWGYGTNGADLRRMVGYWAEEYDWRAAERAINELPHHRTTLDGQVIHYVHRRGRGPAPLPIVLTHGWPWTFWDWHDLIDPLADPAAHGGDPADAFDVIVPSLPGYGFSVPLALDDVNPARIASLWDRLLRDELGYDRFAAAGGDWGSAVTQQLALRHRESMIGIYLSTPPIGLIGGVGSISPDDYGEGEETWAARTAVRWPTTASHVAVHTADPQTLAWALNDSPAGLAAWILERRRAWSDCDGDLASAFSVDFLLTTLSLYWFTQSIGPSMQIYADTFRKAPIGGGAGPARIEVPTGIGVFPQEVVLLPRKAAARCVNLTHWSVLPRGGHFAPAEQPALYVDELRRCFRTLR